MMTRPVVDPATSVAFAFVDVFADRPLTGNPLAVVPDADELPVERMRALAAEFNLSETTFLMRPTRGGAHQRLRSFTAAGHEVTGAGHNALGAWLWLAQAGRVSAGDFRQQIGDDLLDVGVDVARGGRVEVVMAQSAPQIGPPLTSCAPLVAALGVTEQDLNTTVPVCVASTGVAHLLVPLRDRSAVDRVAVDAVALRRILAAAGGEGCYVFTTDGLDDADAYSRFVNPTMGIVEDPATGTAAGPLAALLVRHGRARTGIAVRIDQGHALGRPSRLLVTVSGDQVSLSGSGLVVAEGRISI
jgi:PhzF family phenazine biosynthesis protein